VRICIVYDCLYPNTVGGAERWYRELSTRLAAEGHAVTYLTLRQWAGEGGDFLDGVEVVAVGPRMALYESSGRRRILPPLVFGAGVFWRLLLTGSRQDVVHTASFPFFSLLAAGLLRPLCGYRLVVDWHEHWSKAYWRGYLGGLGGRIGWAVQALCSRVPQRAFCFAQLTAERLEAAGVNGPVSVLTGEYGGSLEPMAPVEAEMLVVAAARHIPEKRLEAVVAAVAEARRALPALTGRILGDGPERGRVLAAIAERGLEGVVEAPGRVSAEAVEQDLARALCLVHPSAREGYGLVVVEAAAAGTPVVLVRGEDNAAVELVEEGVNGFVAPSAEARDLADAIGRVHAGGEALRASTRAWFARNARRLSIETSLTEVVASYRG
jgi:glycosyltransferase involved in cell wall biosynthesis